MKATEKKTKKIKKGDRVLAIAGNYRGQTGTVLLVTGDGAVVQGLNIKKKHVKKSNTHPQGGIIEIEKPINYVQPYGVLMHRSAFKAENEGDRRSAKRTCL